MSGSQIGGAVGFAIGAYFGYPQAGYMIGSAIGGAVDPEVIQGPRINDAQTQMSNDGVPRPIVYGVGAIAGNVIARGPLNHRTVTTSQGKGGPEVEEDHVYMTYAIRICQGPIAGVRRVWRDDKLVYDISAIDDRPEYADLSIVQKIALAAALNAGSGPWSSKATFYLGGEDQLPDPSLEAIFGVGDTPAYRGSAYLVMKEEDLTATAGRLPQYRFEVVSEGTVSTADNSEIDVPRLSAFTNAHWPLVDAESAYTYSGSQVLKDGTDLTFSAATIQGVLDYFHTNNGYGYTQSQFIGYSSAQDRSAVTDKGFDSAIAQPSVIANEKLTLLYNNEEPLGWYAFNAGADVCPVMPRALPDGEWYGSAEGVLMALVETTDPRYSVLRGYYACGGNNGTLVGLPPIVITVSRTIVPPTSTDTFPLPDASGYSVDRYGELSRDRTYTLTAGTFKQLGLDVLENIPGEPLGVNRYAYFQVGPILPSTDADYSSETYWAAAYTAAVAEGTIASGKTYSATGTDGPNTYPQLVSEAYLSTATITTLSPTSVFLSDIVLDIADQVGVSASKLDVSELTTTTVRGYVIGRQMEASGALRGLQTPFLFDMPEWDAKVRCVMRGGAIKAVVTDDELLENEEEEFSRAQPVEFPRKLHVAYPDPSKSYAVTKQTSERTSSQVKAEGEATVELALTLYGSEAATIGSRLHKIAWADAEGGAKLSVPEEFSYLMPSDCIERNGKRYRIEKRQAADGENKLELRFDRASAYTSSVSGSTSQNPTDVGNLKGPTMLIAVNVQNLRTQDVGPGIYVGVAGLLPGWPGCDLKMSSDSGVTYRSVAQIRSPSVMGFLTQDITASSEPITVKMYGTELDSATAAQIAVGENAFAITSSDSLRVEVGQFQTATLVGDELYELTTVTRGSQETTAAVHFEGDRFLLLESAIFIPLDASLGGSTLLFRPVTAGTVDANNETYSVVFDPPTFVLDGGGA